ncbi:MAG: nicotinamide-nucleotide amidohydrolase family protein [Spirochaetia bacterium]|nr:nicotinamide-nucleotide amidohydrolase family protein [Spirochaetia bacterium]
MRKLTAAVCIIGTELVRGVIQDGHAKLISSEMTALGFSLEQIVIIPDDNGISRFLCDLVGNVDVIITTGGLGPTADDITRNVIAQAAGVDLVEDAVARAHLVSRLNRDPGEANLSQVRFPRGFSIIPNPLGTAPGFYGTITGSESEQKNTLILSMPGPPVEMQEMFLVRVLPLVKQIFHIAQEEGRTEASVFLIPESLLEEACRICAVPGVTWGTRIQPLRISLYLISGAAEARDLMLEKITEYLGPELVVSGNRMPYDSLLSNLKENGLVIAGAESCTGGLAAKILTDTAGSSSYFWGTAVTYHNSAKEKLLQIPHEKLVRYGAVSRETVSAMAEQMLQISGADAAYSISGIAGPDGGTSDKDGGYSVIPAGTIWFGFAAGGRKVSAVSMKFHAYTRASVRNRAALAAMLLLDSYLRGKEPLDIVTKWQYS